MSPPCCIARCHERRPAGTPPIGGENLSAGCIFVYDSARDVEQQDRRFFAPAAGVSRSRCSGLLVARRPLGRHARRAGPSGLEQRDPASRSRAPPGCSAANAVVGTAVGEDASGEAEIVVFAKRRSRWRARWAGFRWSRGHGPDRGSQGAQGGQAAGRRRVPPSRFTEARSDRHLHRQRRRVLGEERSAPGSKDGLGPRLSRSATTTSTRLKTKLRSAARCCSRPLRQRLRLQRDERDRARCSAYSPISFSTLGEQRRRCGDRDHHHRQPGQLDPGGRLRHSPRRPRRPRPSAWRSRSSAARRR